MFIEKLELKNFRSHQRTNFQFERVNVIRGHHAVGKSSIALAIEFLPGKDGVASLANAQYQQSLCAAVADAIAAVRNTLEARK